VDEREKFAECVKAINIALARIFGVPDAKNGGKLDKPAYHSRILQPDIRRRIMRTAKGILMAKHKLPALEHVFDLDWDTRGLFVGEEGDDADAA
jgi:hypothetical protein